MLEEPEFTRREDVGAGQPQARPARAKHMRRAPIAACAVALAAACILASLVSGIVAPPGAAAKYGTLSYVAEEDVTEYIETYKGQMVGQSASDADWAAFLAAYNLTPERLRISTVDQLVTDAFVREECQRLGIRVADEELDQALEGYKAQFASGSDKIWSETLGQVGQTEGGFRSSIELALLKQKLAEHEVPEPQPNDGQVKDAIASYISAAVSNEQPLLLKDVYCFRAPITSEENSFEEGKELEKVRKELLHKGATAENFAGLVARYGDDALKESGGAEGWSADTSARSEAYVKALETVNSTGDVSSVFTDEDCHFFIMVDDVYELPEDSSKAADVDLSTLPDALRSYFTELAVAAQWQPEKESYLLGLAKDLNITVFPMPSGVPYNVDMSLAPDETGE